MPQGDWKDRLRACFESIEILERCRLETHENFKQFCEFIAEPAFETLVEELKAYKIKAKFRTLRGSLIHLRISFSYSRADHFHYIVSLPNNSTELKLRLRVRGRKTARSPWLEEEEPFLTEFPPDKVMKISKEELIEDVIEHYENFTLKALASPE
jgi:hypothetical protein